jgi:antitoxin component YwqK of YwqJK toxin-antitoxin module
MTSIKNTLNGLVGRGALYVSALALPLLFATGCSEPESLAMAELVLEGGEYLHPVTREPYSGTAFAAYDDPPQHIERRASLRDGRYDGPFELFYEDHTLSLREVYRQGQKDGPYEWYFEDGQLYERGTYVNGLREGPYEAYFGHGKLYEKGTYRFGDFHGAREWYRGGQLIEQVTYVDGQIDGPYERYSPDGGVAFRGTLRYGNPCGTWIEGSDRVNYPTCGFVSD